LLDPQRCVRISKPWIWEGDRSSEGDIIEP
jgi:hypothetical protein